jgi:hypothetical protein
VSTTRADIRRTEKEVDVLCGLAEMLVSSHAPIGFGPEYRRECDELVAMLEQIPQRFRALVARARLDHGWAKR